MTPSETIADVKGLDDWLCRGGAKLVAKGVYVSSAIRKAALLRYQGRVTREGRILEIKWKSVGSGCYLAYLDI